MVTLEAASRSISPVSERGVLPRPETVAPQTSSRRWGSFVHAPEQAQAPVVHGLRMLQLDQQQEAARRTAPGVILAGASRTNDGIHARLGRQI